MPDVDPVVAEIDELEQPELGASSEPPAPAEPQAAQPEAEPAGQEEEEEEEEFPFSEAELDEALRAQPSGQQQPAELGQAELEQLEELVEEIADEHGPLAAVNWLAGLMVQGQMANYEEQVEAELQPIRDTTFELKAASTMDQLRADFGPEVVEAHRERVAELVSASPDHYANPDTQLERLRQAFVLAQAEARAAYERGDEVIAEIEGIPYESKRDIFGANWQSSPPPPEVVMPPDQAPAAAEAAATGEGQPRDPATGRFLPRGQVLRGGEWVSNGDGTFSRLERTFHVEGGSTPAPAYMSRQQNADPVKAEIDALDTATDAFGRKPGL